MKELIKFQHTKRYELYNVEFTFSNEKGYKREDLKDVIPK